MRKTGYLTICIILILCSAAPSLQGNATKEFTTVITFNVDEGEQIRTIGLKSTEEFTGAIVREHTKIIIGNNTNNATYMTWNEDTSNASEEKIYFKPYYIEKQKQKENIFLRLFVPQQYIEKNKTIETLSITLEITTAIEKDNYLYRRLPALISTEESTVQPQETIEYLIITNSSYYPLAKDNYAPWKKETDGKINTIRIVNISDIETEESVWVNGTYGDATNTSNGNPFIPDGKEIDSSFALFNDTQAHIRNYIRYMVDSYNTSYVLLFGNNDVVPARLVEMHAHSGPNGSWYNNSAKPSDMYYSNLDYCMNNNTNNVWMENRFDGFYWINDGNGIAEHDEIDWAYDVLVGRVLVDSTQEAYNWINKTKAYCNGNNQGNYLRNGIVASRDTNNNIDDSVWNMIGDEFSNTLTFLNGQNISNTQFNNMYNYCNGIQEGWDGFNIIHHTGHSGTHSGTLWDVYRPALLNNTAIPNFVYSEGCHAGDFSASASCIEDWIRDDACAHAAIANSCWGWFVASTWYGEEMFAQMFNETRGIHETVFAKAHMESKNEVSYTLHPVCPMIIKETNYFGDPAAEYTFYEQESENETDPYVYAAGANSNSVYEFDYDDLTKTRQTANHTGTIWEVLTDDGYLYVATDNPANRVYKYDLATLTEQGNYSYGDYIYAMDQDDEYIYAGGSWAVGTVHQIWKSNMTKKGETPAYSDWSNIRSITIDNDYIYVAGDVTRTVKQYQKSDLSHVDTTANFGSDIYDVELDDTYVYACGGKQSWSTGGEVRQYWKSNMTMKASLAGLSGGISRAIAIDDTHVYVGGVENGLNRIWKSNITEKDNSSSYGGAIYALHIHGDYIYVGGGTTNRVYRYYLSNMTKKDESDSYGGTIYGIALGTWEPPNYLPDVFDEDPIDNNTDISIFYNQVSVNISDPEGDKFNVFIQGDFITDSILYDQTNGTFSAAVNYPLPLNKLITWHIAIQSNASTEGKWTNHSFSFTTTDGPIPDSVYVNQSYTLSTTGWLYDKFNTIADAISKIADNGTIYVYNGTYNQTDELYIDRPMNLIGENRTQTIIQRNGTKQHRLLTIENLWDNYSTIDGFTFQGGYANMSNRNGIGGNILIVNSLNATINNSIIKDGFAAQYGGGIQLEAGGNLKNSTVHNCAVTSTGMNAGGGISLRYGGNVVDYCYIVNNTGSVGGGVLLKYGANPPYQNKVIHCTIANNTAYGYLGAYYGGGIASQGEGWTTSEIHDSIVYYNTPNNILDVDGSLDIDNVKYSCVAPDWGGTGNVGYEPFFVFNSSGSIEENYRLFSASPARGKASDGENMGAYQGDEYEPSPNYAPILENPTPGDGAQNQLTNITWSIPIEDFNWQEKINWTITCNNSQQISITNDTDGEKHINLTNLSRGVMYTIWVNVTDGEEWTNGTYTFNTTDNRPPDVIKTYSTESSTGFGKNYTSVYDVFLNTTVSDPDGDAVNVSYYLDGRKILEYTNIANGSLVSLNTSTITNLTYWENGSGNWEPRNILNHSTNYTWYVIVDDGIDTKTSSTQYFTTSEPWDIIEDGDMNLDDITQGLVVDWYYMDEPTEVGGKLPSDINDDGYIDLNDLSLFSSHWYDDTWYE